MEGDDLMADDVVARSEVAGERKSGSEVLVDEGVGDPGVGAGIHKCGLGDLLPAEVGGRCAGAFAVAGGNVVDDGAFVGLGPGASRKKC